MKNNEALHDREMSWVQDEWKDGLPGNALTKISELENDCERVNKEKKCLQFQVDSLKASLDKCRMTEEETKKEKQEAERNLSSFMNELDAAKEALEKVSAVSKEKDVTILNLSNELAKVNKEKDAEKDRRLEVEKENDKLLHEIHIKDKRLEMISLELERKIRDVEGEIACEKFEHQKLMEENKRLKEERELEREERWVAEKELQGMNNTEIKAQAMTLKRRIATKEKETSDLYERIAKLESVLRANNTSEIDVDKHSEASNERLSNLKTVESDSQKDTAEFVRKISVMKDQIFELEKENEILRASVSDVKTRALQADRAADSETESLRASVNDQDCLLEVAVKGRDDAEKRLRDEREMFMLEEDRLNRELNGLREEINRNKEQWQEEREMFIEQESHLQKRLEELMKERNFHNVHHQDSEEFLIQTLETDKRDLNNKLTSLAAKVDSLERMKAHLENENEQLLTEIRRGKDYCSDVEETMKEDIDSVRSCLQDKIDKLELDMDTKTKEARDLKIHVDELYNELDEVNKILATEREKSKRLEIESLEFKKKERSYENAIASSFGCDEKSMVSNFVKKRGERWNGDVVELRKKVEELERKNRELTNAVDKKDYSVEAIKQGFENKLREEKSRKEGRAFRTPESASSSKELMLKYSSYSTPVSRTSSKQMTELDQSVSSKDEVVMQLREKLMAAELDKDETLKARNAKIQILEEEIAFLKQHIRGSADSRQGGLAKMAPNTMITPKKFQKDEKEIENQDASCGSLCKATNSSASNNGKWNTLDELKDLVAEYETESSELQEIIDESKEAIFELKKALQGNEGLFLVDSANMEEIKKIASLSKSDLDILDHSDKQFSNIRSQNRHDGISEKQSYILSRLSLTDIDVGAVLSKLRIAINQLESRLVKIHDDKAVVERTIHTIENGALDSTNSISKSMEEISCVRDRKESELRVTRSAVIDIARERDAIITDGTIDDIAHEENMRPKEDKIFQHGPRCKLLWQQLCDAKASLSKYDREMTKQKHIYEKQIAEIQNNKQRACNEEIYTLTDQGKVKQALEEKEEAIKRLESQLVQEKRSSQLLLEEIEACRTNFDESQEKNYKLAEKLEETRSLLFQHHKSNDKKLDAILNCLQDGLLDQMRNIVEKEQRRKASPSDVRLLCNSGNSKHSSRNTSFFSPEENKLAEAVSKRSHSRRQKGDTKCHRAVSHVYHTLDELENVKGKMSGIQDQVKGLLACIDQANREKVKVQDECKHLLQRMEEKDEQIKRAEANLESERHRMKDNDTEYRAELDALKAEQLEVFQEFREMCENVKRKDVEILNKNKQIKLQKSEWKEKEESLVTQVETLQKENKTLWTENSELRVEVERSKNIKEEFTRKMKNSEDNLSQLYQKLSQVDSIIYECKQKGLYK